jgi:hypothetical protein
MSLGKLNIESIDLSKLTEYIDSIPGMQKPIENAVRGIVYDAANDIKSDLRGSTPVFSGKMRENWGIRRGEQGTGIVTSVSIRNTSVQGPSVELGVVPGMSPWPSPSKGRGRRKSNRKVQERTVLSKGRIWSTQAVGGITPKVIKRTVVNLLSKRIADSIVSVLVK